MFLVIISKISCKLFFEFRKMSCPSVFHSFIRIIGTCDCRRLFSLREIFVLKVLSHHSNFHSWGHNRCAKTTRRNTKITSTQLEWGIMPHVQTIIDVFHCMILEDVPLNISNMNNTNLKKKLPIFFRPLPSDPASGNSLWTYQESCRDTAKKRRN